jgi:diguanylate cyclase (GGDEF)-like protein/PAS domain S-box-containing protein
MARPGTLLRGARRPSESPQLKQRLPWPTRAIVAASVVGGFLVLGYAVTDQGPLTAMPAHQWMVTGVLCALAIASWVRPIVLYRDKQSEAFHLDEGFFVVLALLVPLPATVATFAIATLVSQLVKRRPLIKSAFNFGEVLVSAALGLAVRNLVGGPYGSISPRTLAGAVLGGLVYFIVSHGSVASVLVSTGSTWRACLVEDLRVQLALLVSGMLVGCVFAITTNAVPWGLGVAVPLLITFRVVVAAQFHAYHDRERLQGLFDVTLEANRRLHAGAIQETIVSSAAELLRCGEARLETTPPPPTAMAAPIQTNGSGQWLVVAGRRREEPFDQADRILLDAIAAVGSGALTNAELYRQIRFERERLGSIALSIGEGVCAVDLDGRITFVNPAAMEIVDIPGCAVEGNGVIVQESQPAPDFLLAPARLAIQRGRVVREDDIALPARGGGTVPVAYTVSPILDNGRAVGAVIALRDITERKAYEDEMTRHAFYDSLTGLANRRLLVERLERALLRSERDGKIHALIFVDVDRFKSINDSLGHGTGDDLLVAIGARMKDAVRGYDLLARFGGDEFVLLMEDVTGVDQVVAAARRLCAAVEKPLVLSEGYEVVVSLSIGIALTEPGRTADDMLRNADVAMYEAKVKGRGGTYEVFDTAAMGTRSAERLDLEAALRKGMDRGELEVYYQPFFSIHDRRIVGAEALVRWWHPTHGLIEPARFIPMAEETGLILPLGRYVLEYACRQAVSIRERLWTELPISVNLSPRQFQHSALLADVTSALQNVALAPEMVTFEITESMVMNDLARAQEVMKKLNNLGVRLAIDDFGTGHSSLSYLKRFPVQEVKVDRVFVEGVATDPVDSAIVRAVIELASAMNITAVAEGVETAEQLDHLLALGCPVAQGFYFSRPLPAPEFEALLAGGTIASSAEPAVSR